MRISAVAEADVDHNNGLVRLRLTSFESNGAAAYQGRFVHVVLTPQMAVKVAWLLLQAAAQECWAEVRRKDPRTSP
jgi:hypothetical protein